MKLWTKTKEFFEGKFLVVRRDGTIPHWPHFVLGARDVHAPAALRAYAEAVRQAGVLDPEFADSVMELACDFERYRDKHGDGDPDAPPHRRDNQSVIFAMRGYDATIEVVRDRRNNSKVTHTSPERAPSGD